MQRSPWSFVNDTEWNMMLYLAEHPETKTGFKLYSAFEQRLGLTRTKNALDYLRKKGLIFFRVDFDGYTDIILTFRAEELITLGKDIIEKFKTLEIDYAARR
jgi:hypothetical protein